MLKLAAQYFALVFAVGFVLGIFRVLLLVPVIGARSAELIEIPLMLVFVYVCGSQIARRTTTPKQALCVGMVALLMLLAAEFGLALVLYRKSPWDVLSSKDPISGTAYYASLVFFAVLPWLVANSRQS